MLFAPCDLIARQRLYAPGAALTSDPQVVPGRGVVGGQQPRRHTHPRPPVLITREDVVASPTRGPIRPARIAGGSLCPRLPLSDWMSARPMPASVSCSPTA